MPGLTGTEQTTIREVLRNVKKLAVKTVQTADGTTVQSMEPVFYQIHMSPFEGPPKTQTLGPRAVTWICLPYFTLEKYSGLSGAAGHPYAFPAPTLAQAGFARAARSRDMRQAVCAQTRSDGRCYHVAQLWCLVVNNCQSFLLGFYNHHLPN